MGCNWAAPAPRGTALTAPSPTRRASGPLTHRAQKAPRKKHSPGLLVFKKCHTSANKRLYPSPNKERHKETNSRKAKSRWDKISLMPPRSVTSVWDRQKGFWRETQHWSIRRILKSLEDSSHREAGSRPSSLPTEKAGGSRFSSFPLPRGHTSPEPVRVADVQKEEGLKLVSTPFPNLLFQTHLAIQENYGCSQKDAHLQRPVQATAFELQCQVQEDVRRPYEKEGAPAASFRWWCLFHQRQPGLPSRGGKAFAAGVRETPR